MFKVGDVLNKRYKLIAQLAYGNQSEAYKAHDQKSQTDCFIKIPLDSSQANLIEQANLLKSVSDTDYVVKILGVDEHEGRKFIIQEYVEGGNLAELLKNGPLPLNSAIDLMLGICEGLYAMHNASILHLDLKPSNIMLTSEKKPKITDFGTAMLNSTDTVLSGGKYYTLRYMAPEQCDPNRWGGLSPQTDIWALGIIFYEILTCKYPFPLPTVNTVLAWYVSATTNTCQTENLPVEVREIISLCLKRRQRERFNTIGDLLNALRKLRHAEAQSNIEIAKTKREEARIACEAKKYDKALSLLEEARKLNECAFVWYRIGYVRELLGDENNAYQAYLKCLSFDAKHTHAMDRVKILEAKLGETAAANRTAKREDHKATEVKNANTALDGTTDVEMQCKCGAKWTYTRQQQAKHILDFGAANRKRCTKCVQAKVVAPQSSPNDIEGTVRILGPGEQSRWGFISVEGMPDFYFDIDHCVGRRMPNVGEQVLFIPRRYGDKSRPSAANVRNNPDKN